jgi:hypothetical protein
MVPATGRRNTSATREEIMTSTPNDDTRKALLADDSQWLLLEVAHRSLAAIIGNHLASHDLTEALAQGVVRSMSRSGSKRALLSSKAWREQLKIEFWGATPGGRHEMGTWSGSPLAEIIPIGRTESYRAPPTPGGPRVEWRQPPPVRGPVIAKPVRDQAFFAHRGDFEALMSKKQPQPRAAQDEAAVTIPTKAGELTEHQKLIIAAIQRAFPKGINGVRTSIIIQGLDKGAWNTECTRRGIPKCSLPDHKTVDNAVGRVPKKRLSRKRPRKAQSGKR